MLSLYNKISHQVSYSITTTYSTSFALAIRLLNKKLRQPIYDIYGFVRLADEIVDTFHHQDKAALLRDFTAQTWQSLRNEFSLNPILHSFQFTAHKYKIDEESIRLFLESMEMDLHKQDYDTEKYDKYIVGSAEVVGLMCLRVFCENNPTLYNELYPYARKLGAAFQKINFLRDLKADYLGLGRVYFPNVSLEAFDESTKKKIERDIEADFAEGLKGIRKLPKSARFGVYLAYMYYYKLFQKICRVPSERVMEERIRISDTRKYGIFIMSYFRNELNLI